ncbi:MAG: FMN-binding protein, partial [Planctomycetota bacterium]
ATSPSFITRTAPFSDAISGYRGPTESMIWLDAQEKIVGIDLLHSEDTAEHVDAVERNMQFLQPFLQRSIHQPPDLRGIDGVSGATLTALAMAEGILLRMEAESGVVVENKRRSLVFSDALKIADVQSVYPNVVRLRTEGLWSIGIDEQSAPVCLCLRTAPLCDDQIGYQGPSDYLVCFSCQDTSNRAEQSGGQSATVEIDDWKQRVQSGRLPVHRIRLLVSKDNSPYVSYLNDDYGFWPMLEGKTLPQIAELNLQEEGIEGVSGATMTSMAAAETMVQVGREVKDMASITSVASPTEAQRVLRSSWASPMILPRFAIADVGMLGGLILLFVFHRASMMRRRMVRVCWLFAVIAVIGLWAGNFVSLALVSGWSVAGIPWRLAPGLSLLAIVAFVVPAFSSGNPYCNHLCPHGASQQLLLPVTRLGFAKRIRNQARWARHFRTLPAVMLVLVYWGLLIWPRLDVSTIEPFQGYLFGIAGFGMIVFVLASLAVSAILPMAHCRMACPTGVLFDYLRMTRSSSRFGTGDRIALAMLVFGITIRCVM